MFVVLIFRSSSYMWRSLLQFSGVVRIVLVVWDYAFFVGVGVSPEVRSDFAFLKFVSSIGFFLCLFDVVG